MRQVRRKVEAILTEQQIAQRQFSLGASDIPAVCGVSPYKTALDVWTAKVHGPQPASQRLALLAGWGHRIEPVIREWYNGNGDFPYGPGFAKEGETVWHSAEPWASATPDAIFVEDGTHRAIRGVEIKNRSKSDAPRWKDHVPCDVAAQCYWSMWVTGLTEWDVVALLNGNTPVQHRLSWDSAVIEDIVAVARHFWNAVEAKTEPEMYWVSDELDYLRRALVNEADEAAFKRAAYWARRDKGANV